MSQNHLISPEWLPSPRKITDRFSARLDMFRWVAALLVCTAHLRSVALTDYDLLKQPGWLARIFYGLHGFGHEAVMFFFVLSGYLVGGEILRSLKKGKFDWRTYLIRRVARLYTVYLAALLIGGLLDRLGANFFTDTGIYNQAAASPMISYNVSERLGAGTLLENLFFCQQILVPCYGSNVPLWSLTNEAWYYLLFPLMAWPLFGRCRWRWRWLCLGLVTAAGWFVRGEILLCFSIWLAGLLPHFLPRPLITRALPLVCLLLAIMFAIRSHLIEQRSLFFAHLLLAVVFTLLLNTLEHTSRFAPSDDRWHKRLAGFSYSLYLLHWPLALFLTAASAHFFGFGFREPFMLSGIFFYLAVLISVYAAAFGLASLTERHTGQIRSWLSAAFKPRAEAVSSPGLPR